MSGRDEFIGNSRRNLILKTASSIRVLVGDKYYDLNFKGSDNKEKEEKELEPSKFIIVKDFSDYDKGKIDYPGDGFIIFSLSGEIYYTNNGKYNSYSSSNIELIEEEEEIQNIFQDSVIFNASIPFLVNSRNLVQNLNSQYLNGYDSNDFILNKDKIKLNELVVESISSSDNKFFYKDGVFSFSREEEEFISNKRIIGSGTEVLDVEEIEESKFVPYVGLLESLLDVLIKNEYNPYDYINSMLSVVNVNDLPDVSKLEFNEQVTFYRSLKNVCFAIKNSDLWDDDKFVDIKNRFCDLSVLDFMKTSYKMNVSSTSGIGLYDFGKIKVSHNAYVNGDEIITNRCIDLDYEIKTIEEEYDCIVTSIGDDFICVTTNFESNYYKYSEIDIIETSIIIDGEEFKYSYSWPIIKDESFDCEFERNIVGSGEFSNKNIIGDLSGEVVDGFGELYGHGLLLRDGCYLFDPVINNSIKYLNLAEDYVLDLPKSRDYSIKSNGYNILFSDYKYNGMCVNLYLIDDCNIIIEKDIIPCHSGDYITFRCIPINEEDCKWIHTTNNNWVEK